MEKSAVHLQDQRTGKWMTISNTRQTVTIYNCGPTVSDFIHIGHVRNALQVDLLARTLTAKGAAVLTVTNVTDISDKIARRADQEGVSEREISEVFRNAWQADLLRSNINLPNIVIPDTVHVDSIIRFILALVESGHAEVRNTSVYFRGFGSDRDTAIFPGSFDGGFLSEKLTDEFLLWDGQVNPGHIFWDSPWGAGRPGKHIPCSDVIHQYIDPHGLFVHCGGSDLVRHHAGELAQNLARGDQAANIWLYNGMVMVDSQKMGKSAGNSVTVRTLLSQYDANAIRWYLFQVPFFDTITFDAIDLSCAADDWNQIHDVVKNVVGEKKPLPEGRLYDELMASLSQGLQTHAVLGEISDYVHRPHDRNDILQCAHVLKVMGFTL